MFVFFVFFFYFVLGPGEIPVWQKQDLLQSWPGGFLGEAALGQIAYGLCLHPEDYSLLAGTQKVPEDEGVCHYYSETCTGSPGTLVSEDAKQEQKFDFRNFMDILDVFLKCFFLSVMPSFCCKPEQLLSFSAMCECGRKGNSTSSSVLQLSLFSASGGLTWLESSTIR